MDQENRIVVLIDMDCFYCQVEEKLNPELRGKPIAVVQYNPWKGGGIIAVNYAARAMGVNRHMRGDDAKEKCPEIQLPSVPCPKGKADISKYRDAGIEVAKVLQKYTTLLERASIDEAYLDITIPVQKRLQSLNVNTLTCSAMPNTFALGYDSFDDFISDIHNCGSDSIEFDYEHAKNLLVGALIVSEIRAAVYEETGYRCSAGIAHNKILAKLVCGMNKPNKQTVLPKHSVDMLYKTLPINKVKHLGGKFGNNVCEVLKIKTMGELQTFSEKVLQAKFDDKNGTWLYNIARGIDTEPVQARFNPKSIGCCKNFSGKSALLDLDSVKKWLNDLGDEIENRLEKDALENNRTPKQMVVSFSVQFPGGKEVSSSRSYNFAPDDELCGELFTNKAFEVLMDSTEGCKPKEGESNRKLRAPIKFLGISVGKFEDNNDNKKTKKIKDYFCAGSSKEIVQKSNETLKQGSGKDQDKKPKNNNVGKDYVLHKFFQTTDDKKQNVIKEEAFGSSNEKVLESPLDKQESFFAKLLNNDQRDKRTINKECDDDTEPHNNKVNRSMSPVCNVERGDDSNDTTYSGSTINEEINKSIALFEEDPLEIARVSNMRDLLKTSNEIKVEHNEEPFKTFKTEVVSRTVTPEITDRNNIETVECFQCGKAVPLDKFDEHADYHIALNLREEEREEMRKTREKTTVKEINKEVKKKKPQQEINKSETMPSISKFFTKFDSTIPKKMCIECGEKVATEKFSEHLDFHEAQKLSRELNKKPVLNTCSNNSVKRKRISTSPLKNSKSACKSIDTFFR